MLHHFPGKQHRLDFLISWLSFCYNLQIVLCNFFIINRLN
jgi:hypothetical protein